MADDQDLDTAAMEKVSFRHFIEWCQEHPEWHRDDANRRALEAGLHVSPRDIGVLAAMLDDPISACELVLPLWPMLALSGRPPARHVPDFIHVAISLAFNVNSTDTRGVRLESPVRWKPGSPMTDGFLVAFLRDQTTMMTRIIAEQGLDKLYEEQALPVGDTRPKPKPLRPTGDSLFP